MKRLLPLLAVLALAAAASAWWLSTRVKMTVEHPETPQAEIPTPELPKEDPAIVLAVRNSIPNADTEAGLAEMMKSGADPNAVDLKGRPVLYWAIANGHEKTAEALIAAGADVNKVDADMHWTPLMHAVYQAARDPRAEQDGGAADRERRRRESEPGRLYGAARGGE